MPPISNDWANALSPEYKKQYYRDLFNFIGEEYATHQVFPPGDDIFNAFHLTPLSEVKCVITRSLRRIWAVIFQITDTL